MKIGSASKHSIIAKTTTKVASEFALGAVRGIWSHQDLANMQERVVAAVVTMIEQAVFNKVSSPFRSKLVALAAQETNPDTFHARCQELKCKIHLTPGSLLSPVFDQLYFQVVLSLNDTYNKTANSLSKSKSMAVRSGEKVAIMVDKATSTVQKRLNVANAVSTFARLLDIEEWSSTTEVQNVDESIVDRELDDIKQHLKQTIQKHFQQRLTSASESMIKGSLKKIALAGKNCTKESVQKAFNGSTSSQNVRNLQLKRRTFPTHEIIPITSGSTSLSRPRSQAQKKQRAYEMRREGFQKIVLKPKHIEYTKRSRVETVLQLLDSRKLPKEPYNHLTSVCQVNSQWFLNFSDVQKNFGATHMLKNIETSVTETMKPSLPKLLQLQVPRNVGPNYFDFGIILLDDKDGTILPCIEFDCGRDCENIVRKILIIWLRGSGQPVTWNALIKTLKNCELTTLDKLADKISAGLQ